MESIAPLEQAPGRESYALTGPDPCKATHAALNELLPARADFAAKPMSRPEAAAALFNGRAAWGTIDAWRYVRPAPSWALAILASELERKAARCLELAKRLRSL